MRSLWRSILGSFVAAAVGSALIPASHGHAEALDDPWGPPVRLVDDKRVYEIGPISTTLSGKAIATWTVDPNGGAGDRVFAAQRALDAETWSAPAPMTPDDVRVWTHTLVERGNQAMLFWQGADADPGFSIWSRPLRKDGTWGSIRHVVSVDARIVRLEAAAGGGSLAVLTVNEDGRGLVLRKDRGEGWEELVALPDNFSAHEVAIDGARVTVAGATYEGEAGSIDVLTWSDDAWSTQRVGPRTGWVLDIPNVNVLGSSNPEGAQAFLWKELDEDDPDGPAALVVAYRGADEPDVGDAVVLTASATCPAFRGTCGDIGISRTGVLTAVWSDADLGDTAAPGVGTSTPYGLLLSRRDLDGIWSAPSALLTSDDDMHPAVDVHLTGPALVAAAVDIGEVESIHVVSCGKEGSCGEPTVLVQPPAWVPSDLSAGPRRSGTYLWGAGCRTEECLPRHVMARSLPPI